MSEKYPAENNPLGKSTQYVSQYSPQLLFAIARSEKRNELKLSENPKNLDLSAGQDIWNAYEISWLNPKGLPQVAIGEFRFDAASEFIVESKSLKLYLNSFNQSCFSSIEQVSEIIAQDLTAVTGLSVKVSLYAPSEFDAFQVDSLNGLLLDNMDIKIDQYNYQADILFNSTSSDNLVKETLVSHLLKSNCLITSQPDWASIQIRYEGAQIDHQVLLKYLVSFRSHNEFHEQCVERIFYDLKRYCRPDKLSVYARYTRRGGLDINPWRSDFESEMPNLRLARQ